MSSVWCSRALREVLISTDASSHPHIVMTLSLTTAQLCSAHGCSATVNWVKPPRPKKCLSTSVELLRASRLGKAEVISEFCSHQAAPHALLGHLCPAAISLPFAAVSPHRGSSHINVWQEHTCYMKEQTTAHMTEFITICLCRNGAAILRRWLGSPPEQAAAQEPPCQLEHRWSPASQHWL